MKRKKKEDLKAAVYKPFNPDELRKPSYYDITPEMPEIIETTTLGDHTHHYISTRPITPPYEIYPYERSTITGGYATNIWRAYVGTRRLYRYDETYGKGGRIKSESR